MADVDEGPSPTTPGRSHALLAAAALLGAAAFVVAGLTGARDPASSAPVGCADTGVDAVWSDDVAQSLASAFADGGVAFGPTTFTSVRHDLDDYAQTWAAARDEVCGDGRADGDAPQQAVLACLEARKHRLAALVTALGTPDPRAVERSWRAAASLPPIADCGDALPPSSLADASLRERLDAAAVMIDLGRFDDAAAALDALELGEDEPGSAQLLLLRGLLLAERGLVPEAIAELEASVWRSIALDDPGVTFRAATSLARLVSLSPIESEAARRWWQLGSAVADRLPGSPLRQHELLTVRAMLLHRAGEQRAALSLYEPALALGEQHFGTEHPLLLEGLGGAAIAAAEIGQPELGERMALRAVDIGSHALGRSHPEVAEVARAFGAALVAGERPLEAAAWLEKAVDLRGDAVAADEGVHLRLEVGRAWVAAGDPDRAREAFVQASRWLDDHGGDPALRAEIELGLATALEDTGRAGASIDHLRTALAAHAEGGHDPDRALAIRIQLGRALREAMRFDEARTELAGALADAIAAHGEDDPRVGDAQLALSDLALATGAAEEALELARRAVKVFVDARGADDPSVHLALTQLGAACLALGRDRDAVAAFERAVRVAEAAELGAAALGASQLSLASALWRVGDEERAQEIARAARLTVARAEPADGITAAAIEDWFDRRSLDPQG